MYKRYSFLLVIIFILLAGCNQEQTTTNESEEAETEVESEELSNVKEEATEVEEQSENENVIVGSPLPTTLEELEKLPSGYTKYINRLEDEGKQLTDELTKIFRIYRTTQLLKN